VPHPPTRPGSGLPRSGGQKQHDDRGEESLLASLKGFDLVSNRLSIHCYFTFQRLNSTFQVMTINPMTTLMKANRAGRRRYFQVKGLISVRSQAGSRGWIKRYTVT